MKSYIKVITILIFAFLVFNAGVGFSQTKAKPDSSKHNMKKMDCCKKDNSSSAKCPESPEVKSETADSVVLADKNQDGKVFIDGMCKDVIKDEPGNCPKCGMKLKEVTIEEAKIFLDNSTKTKHNN